MDVAAEKATELPRLGSASKKLSAQASHTKKAAQTVQVVTRERERRAPVRIGERQRRSTLWKKREPGIAPSRLKAYIIRELDVTEKVLWRRAA